ncbi:TIGR02281 family clan AA aspartic protease [uncultured Sphingomonas sp.]|uniref:retropepsin-like aspartic protease family protein n=1 Tax=uncultured Sphingomonas sp. TaxID=158754 RepID=UPI0035CB6B3D
MFRSFYAIPILILLVPAAAVPQTLIADVPASTAPASIRNADPVIAPSKRPTVIDQADDGLFYVEAKVNGAIVQFVVDTGSSVVVLSGPDAARAGVAPSNAINAETAGGAARMQRATIDRVDFAGQTLSGVDAAIVRNDLKVSLMGQSALSQLASVTFRGTRLELQ